ncbi:MAG: hypothetical protein AAFW83_11935 [Pseudomonadota bacterium]
MTTLWTDQVQFRPSFGIEDIMLYVFDAQRLEALQTVYKRYAASLRIT